MRGDKSKMQDAQAALAELESRLGSEEKALKDVKDKERDAAHESIALASKVSSMKASADDEAAALMASERQSAQDDKELARRKTAEAAEVSQLASKTAESKHSEQTLKMQLVTANHELTKARKVQAEWKAKVAAAKRRAADVQMEREERQSYQKEMSNESKQKALEGGVPVPKPIAEVSPTADGVAMAQAVVNAHSSVDDPI